VRVHVHGRIGSDPRAPLRIIPFLAVIADGGEPHHRLTNITPNPSTSQVSDCPIPSEFGHDLVLGVQFEPGMVALDAE
jgi:hypothetical protein